MNMKRGLTMVELAVALALLGVLALALALLLGQMGRGSQRAQAEAQLQADLQEVRARLTEDVLQSTALACTPTGASLTLPSGTVTYSLSGGQVLRNGLALTLQRGYGGSFSCDGRTLTLDLTWEGAPVATVTATRRVGLALGGFELGPSVFPIDLRRAHLTNYPSIRRREIRDVSWSNLSGQRLYLQQIEVTLPSGFKVVMIHIGYGIYNTGGDCYYYYQPSGVRVPTPPFPTTSCSVDPGQTIFLKRLRFNSRVDSRPVLLALTLCLTNTFPCPAGRGARLVYRFVCQRNGPCRAL